ncbi:MAG: hypothetical protein PHY16_10965 [Methylobacter sp.]|nr:hypothetical protein [Methylobacter sp.]
MITDEFDKIAGAAGAADVGAGAGIIALLPLLLPLIKDELIPFIKGRNAFNKEKKHIESAKIEIDFIVAWMEAASKFSGEDIENYKLMAQDRLGSLLSPPPVVHKGKPGWLINGVFWVYCGFYLFVILAVTIGNGKKELGSQDIIYGLIGLLVPLISLFFLKEWSRKRNLKLTAQQVAQVESPNSGGSSA